VSDAASCTSLVAGAPVEQRASERWFAILLAAGLSCVAVAALWLTGRSELLRIVIPAAAFFVGVVLYFNAPVRYVEYTLWLWFLTPLVRRLVDWRFGYVDPNFVLLAPLLVSGIGGLSLLRRNRAQKPRIPAPFILCGAAILYAGAINTIRYPSAQTVYGFADWLCPLLFGLHFYLNWADYDRHRAAVIRTFLIGVPVMGLYGIYQFVSPPAWDRFWLTNVRAESLASSFGTAEPFLIRVWSTMNGPGVFANMMTVGLLLLLVVRSPLRVPASVSGYLSLLLSAVRTAWLSWAVGLVVILKSANPRAIARLALSIALLLILVLPLASNSDMAGIISRRADTFADLSRDGSFRDRLNMYKVLAIDALESPFGIGFGGRTDVNGFPLDSGILATIFALGWGGTLLYSLGMLALFPALGRLTGTGDLFSTASKGIVIATLAQVVGGNIFVSATGAVLWLFAGLGLAARKQHRPAVDPPQTG
jgi:hypothetical protein